MKRIPKTPIEFDYDLWTTEDGKCMVRVKRTGEVSEVDREVMKFSALRKRSSDAPTELTAHLRMRTARNTLTAFFLWTLCRTMM